MELPKSEEIMDKHGWKYPNMTKDAYDDMIEMLKEYARRVLDVAADKAEASMFTFQGITSAYVKTESILRLKEMLK